MRFIEPLAWMKDAACLGMAEIMFPDVPENYKGNGQYDNARRVCAQCDVIEQCSDYSLTLLPVPDTGYWGGMTSNKMRRVRVTYEGNQNAAS